MLGLGNSLSNAAVTGGPEIQDISDMELWLKNGVGITSDGGTPDKVSQWDDQSGNARHAAQGDSVKQATLTGGGLDFETDEFNFYDLASNITIAYRGPFTMAWVMQTETTTANATVIADGANEVIQFQNNNKFRFTANNQSGSVNNLATAIYKGGYFDPDEKMMMTFTRNSASEVVLYKNGTAITPHVSLSSNLTNNRGFDLSQVGAKASNIHRFDGVIYELLVFSKLLDADELATLHAEILGKHGL